MNKISLLLFAIGTSGIHAAAQETKHKTIIPPAQVKTAFENSFAGATKVKWEKEGADYEVNFVQQKKELSALFDGKGAWKETEEEIGVSDLPTAIRDYISSHYKGARIKEAAVIKRPGGTVNYEAEINKKDLVFDANGNFIKEEAGETD